MKRLILSVLLCLPLCLLSQTPQEKLTGLEEELTAVEAKREKIETKIEGVKLEILHLDLAAYGLPEIGEGEEVVHHQAMSLVYSEEHEQAKWVAHIIMPEMMTGKVARTNDFRVDPMVKTGTCVEKDYFLKTLKPDSTYDYDGYGYDRGHLAPSADFRWSATALSESYFYSNMSPQDPDFNRGIWADLEGLLRAYIFRNPESRLFVVTGPCLETGLPVVERGINKPSIPKQYFKVVMDMEERKGIGFILPNEKSSAPLASYSMTIDEVERLTGINFFAQLPDALEDQVERQAFTQDWIPVSEQSDVNPLYAPDLPKGHFNTKQAKLYVNKGSEVSICGKVVAARRSRKGNIVINLDRAYPNETFIVFINKEKIANFSYDPEGEWKGKYVKVTGKVSKLGSTPAMFIEKETVIEAYNPANK